MTSSINDELERRIVAFERGGEAGEDLSAKDWMLLILLGIVLPGLVLAWGWQQ